MQDRTEVSAQFPQTDYVGGAMRPSDDMEALRVYLVWRIKEHVRSGGTATEISNKTGLSQGFLSNVKRAKGRLGMRGIPEIAAFFNLTLAQAQELATEHAARAAEARAAARIETRNLMRAIELLREEGIETTQAIREAMIDLLEIEGDLRVDLWVQHIRTARLLERMGRLTQAIRDGQAAEARAKSPSQRHSEPVPIAHARRADKSAK